MYNSIIVSSCLFGSVYICSTSLQAINRPFLENKKIPNNLIIINSSIFIISGSVFLYCISYTLKAVKNI
jgi:hypothetical protein